MRFRPLDVAPLVGAWIEIPVTRYGKVVPKVAPLVGAWIEISSSMLVGMRSKSLLSWERGLKSRWTLHVGAFRRRSSRGSVD